MKQLFLMLAFLLSIVFNSFSQNDDSGNLIYPNNFIISSHAIENGKITYDYTPLTVKGSFGMTVTDLYKPYFSEIKTTIFLVKLDGSSSTLMTTGPTFTKADFTVSGFTYNFSKIKEFSIYIPGTFQLDLGTYKLVLLYQYHFNPAVNLPNLTTAGWAPTVTHGKEWYTHNKTYGFSRQIPPTTISGPETLCDEGNYNILNPGTVTLEDASGIATLTALGNNQWKVARTGQANGNVVLKSINSNGKAITKNIIIGTPVSVISVSGPNQDEVYAPTGVDYREATYIIDNKIEGAEYEWTFTGSSFVTFPYGKTGTIFKINVNKHPGTTPYLCTVKVRIKNSCGTSEYKTIKLKIIPAGPGGGPID